MAFNTVITKPSSPSDFTFFRDFSIQENNLRVLKAAHVSLGNRTYFLFIGYILVLVTVSFLVLIIFYLSIVM